ncbi:MAG: hypothetical protein A6F71_05620 [Cycloclasticus sp. symbiont of Poecilosclerida sp. M]|nr:MAG: hypothetical protein A6F71_05620 [Cycloclasticus sp. symbiont of Poecilosclerida sp. M]
MFNHLLQIASFKSGPQHFKTPIWAVVVCALLFVVVQAYALSLTPGNDLIRMVVASTLKTAVLAALLFGWMSSVDCKQDFLSVLMAFVFVSLLAEVVKLPLTQMVRDLKDTGDAITALLISIPIWAIMVWNIWVLYYCVKQVAQRGTVEVIVVIIVFVMVSEVAGSVFSQVGVPIDLMG